MTDLLLKALEYYGIREYPGRGWNNPAIVAMIRKIFPWAKEDEIPWCSIFLNQVAEEAGYKGSGTAVARDWLNVGSKIPEPSPGDIAIFWRDHPASWKGHVAIFIREYNSSIWVLGGNQRNSVNIAPYSKDRLI